MTIKILMHAFNTRMVCLTLLSSMFAAAPVIAADEPATKDAEQAHTGHRQASPAKLVQLVREATKQFADVNAATAAGYQPFLGCVSGSDHGAMGYHYVNGAFVADNGSSWYISGVPDSRWDNNVLHQLGNVAGSNFEAIDESSLMVSPDSGVTR